MGTRNEIASHNTIGVCRYQQHAVDKVVIVTNKNCSTSFTRKSWDDSMKEKDKKVVAAAYVPSPLMPAKKHKPSSKNYLNI